MRSANKTLLTYFRNRARFLKKESVGVSRIETMAFALAKTSRILAIDRQPEATLCVVSCSMYPFLPKTVLSLAAAFSRDVAVRPLVIAEAEGDLVSAGEGYDILTVSPGTKLSKLRLLADMEGANLVCICDPDLLVEPEGCRTVLLAALAQACDGKEVVAFGIVEGHDDGTMLSQVIALDKWLSHRVLRRFLWAARIGITLPGQFLILSRTLLGRIEGEVDSFLDDLYLGLIARERCAQVLRVPVLVGREEPRSCWASLVTQRIRWMKGLTGLVWRRSIRPSAVVLLFIHYLVYHGLPILVGLGLGVLTGTNPFIAITLFAALAAILSRFSRCSLRTACCYLVVFPCLHLLATILWCLPLRNSLLIRR